MNAPLSTRVNTHIQIATACVFSVYEAVPASSLRTVRPLPVRLLQLCLHFPMLNA